MVLIKSWLKDFNQPSVGSIISSVFLIKLLVQVILDNFANRINEIQIFGHKLKLKVFFTNIMLQNLENDYLGLKEIKYHKTKIVLFQVCVSLCFCVSVRVIGGTPALLPQEEPATFPVITSLLWTLSRLRSKSHICVYVIGMQSQQASCVQGGGQ